MSSVTVHMADFGIRASSPFQPNATQSNEAIQKAYPGLVIDQFALS